MKKVGSLILGVLMLFAVTMFVPVVNAEEEVISDYIENISITKDEENTEANAFIVGFDAKKAFDFTDGNSFIRVVFSVGNNGGSTSSSYYIADTTFTNEPNKSTQITSETISQGLTVGEHVEIYVTIGESDYGYSYVTEANVYQIAFEIRDKDYNIENVRYDTYTSDTIVSKYYDIVGMVADKLNAIYEGKYNINPCMGYETQMTFEAIPVTDGESYIYKNVTVLLENKTLDEIVADFDSKLKESSYSSVLDLNWEDQDYTINNSVISDIKALKEPVTYSATKYNDDGTETVLYSWTFDGSKITDTNFNLDLKLNIGTSKSQETIETLVEDKEKSLVLEFAYHGALPTGTTVKVNVSNKYKNGDYLTLYYFNEETKSLEIIGKNLEVKDGFVELALEHCSEYVLAYQPELIVDTVANEESNNVETSSMSVIKYASMGIISLITLAYLVVSKKKMA